MDSDISSFSPVPKRHRFCPSEAPSNAGSAQFDCHYAQHQDCFPQEHASTTAPILADAQKAHTLKLMLSQSSPDEAAALIAFLHRFQHRRHAAASQHSQAQPLCHSFQSTVSQPSAQNPNIRLPPSTILKLQAAYGQVVQACQHQQQHACDTLPQHATAVADSRQTSLDAFMTQLREIQTPAQHGKESSSMARYSRPAAAAWYDNPAVPAEPSTVAYEPVQPQIQPYWSAYHQEQEPSQPDFMWQTAAAGANCCQAAASQAQASQATVAADSRLLCTQQQAMLHQLAEQKRLRMQQHMAREQQAFLERQAALSPLRPALSFPELVAYWGKCLSLQRCESVYLACHLWTKVQEQVSLISGHIINVGLYRPNTLMLQQPCHMVYRHACKLPCHASSEIVSVVLLAVERQWMQALTSCDVVAGCLGICNVNDSKLLTILQVSIAYMHLLGAEKPWETMLLGCLWLAAKLEECRRGVPTASKAGALVGVDKGVMGGVELYLMQLVNWAPLAGWKDRPLQSEDDSWY